MIKSNKNMSENINSNIFKRIKVLNDLKEEFKINIKFLHVFRDYWVGDQIDKNIFLVTSDDKVFCFGNNRNGLLGFGHENRIEEFIINEHLSNKQIIEFKNGIFYTIARTINGKIYCWGCNACGVLGNGLRYSEIRRIEKGCEVEIYKPELNKYLLNENIIDISCGFYHTLVLTSNGEVYAWGQNKYGQIGNNCNEGCVLVPFKVSEIIEGKFKAIACGRFHSMILSENGRVLSWGLNKSGILGIGTEEDCYSPKLINLDKNIIIDKISCGSSLSLLLSHEKDIYVFGWNGSTCNQLGIKTNSEKQLIPVKLKNSNKFTEIAAHSHYNFSSALSENGFYFIWGLLGKVLIFKPTKTQFRSFQELFIHYLELLPNCGWFHIKNTNKYSSYFSEISKLGSGSFGTVFRVENKITNETFAIKKIKSQNIVGDFFLKELNNSIIILKLENKFLVQYYDFWVEKEFESSNSIIYIQMQFCEKTLSEIHDEITEDSKLYLNDSFTNLGFHILSHMFIQILKGVKFLHRNNIIHRDLKPDNILSKNGIIKIADFGLAKVLDKNRDPNIRNTGNIGAIKYAAPEVINYEDYDTKADIYSLGVISEELFEIDEDRITHYINDDILKQKYENLEKLIERMMNENQSERPNCEQILDKREEWGLSGTGIKTDEELSILLKYGSNALKAEL